MSYDQSPMSYLFYYVEQVEWIETSTDGIPERKRAECFNITALMF